MQRLILASIVTGCIMLAGCTIVQIPGQGEYDLYVPALVMSDRVQSTDDQCPGRSVEPSRSVSLPDSRPSAEPASVKGDPEPSAPTPEPTHNHTPTDSDNGGGRGRGRGRGHMPNHTPPSNHTPLSTGCRH